MEGGFLGADPVDLARLAKEMEEHAELIRQTRSTLGAVVNGDLPWRGPDAYFFRHAWNSSHAPTLASGAELLSAASRKLREQAAAQQQTSNR